MTKFIIKYALYSSQSQHNLFNFKEKCLNEFNVKICSNCNKEFLCITSIKIARSRFWKSSLPSPQDYILKHVALNLQFNNQILEVCHD